MSHDMLLWNVRSYMCDGVRDWKTKVGRKLLRFPPTRLTYYFRILNTLHAHNPFFCLDKHIWKAADNGINLFGCNRLSILTDMQPLAVNHFRNLFSSHPSVLTCEVVKYGFFDFHKLMAISYLARFLLFFLIEFTKS